MMMTDLEWECPRAIGIKTAVKIVDWKVFGAFLGLSLEKVASIDAEQANKREKG